MWKNAQMLAFLPKTGGTEISDHARDLHFAGGVLAESRKHRHIEIAISAQDEFDSFTAKKRTATRTTILADKPEASTSRVDAETPVAISSKTAEKKD
jgi:hypothetical protein